MAVRCAETEFEAQFEESVPMVISYSFNDPILESAYVKAQFPYDNRLSVATPFF